MIFWKIAATIGIGVPAEEEIEGLISVSMAT
jgi:hypothetical protein